MTADVKHPPPKRTFQGRWIRAGATPQKEIQIFWAQPKTSTRLGFDFKKNHGPCILEGHLSTNPISSALHLQGPKSNIYVHSR